jgi:hypothetical protein
MKPESSDTRAAKKAAAERAAAERAFDDALTRRIEDGEYASDHEECGYWPASGATGHYASAIAP